MCTSVLPACVPVHPVCSAYSGRKRVLDPLDLQFQRVASHHMGVGPELGSSARAAVLLSAKLSLQPPTIYNFSSQ